MYSSDVEGIKALSEKYESARKEIAKVIVGQDEIVKTMLIAILSNGHCLLVGVPGLAKTLLVQTIARVLDLSSNRIQFTPDLMPSDITGSEILDEQRTFRFIKGPIFANIVLADEINRTPPKTQAALLEAMQERMVTIAGQVHALPTPFFVLATQNPIEQEGTYPLPEAQLDRFMFNALLDYPSFEEELQIVRTTIQNRKVELDQVITGQQIAYFQHLLRGMPIPDLVLQYAVEVVSKTRPNTAMAGKGIDEWLSWGAGPRASQFLVLGAKCHAAISGKFSPDKEDVKAVAHAILRHRLVRSYKAEAEGKSIDAIIDTLL